MHIQSILCEFNLKTKVDAIVSDNGSNFVKAFKEHSARNVPSQPEDSESEFETEDEDEPFDYDLDEAETLPVQDAYTLEFMEKEQPTHL